MSSCPYCGDSALSATSGLTRFRPDSHTIVQCAGCNGYSCRHKAGNVTPLSDRTDKDGDVVSSVVDD